MKAILYLDGLAPMLRLPGNPELTPFDLAGRTVHIESVYRNPISNDFMLIAEIDEPTPELPEAMDELFDKGFEADLNDAQPMDWEDLYGRLFL